MLPDQAIKSNDLFLADVVDREIVSFLANVASSSLKKHLLISFFEYKYIEDESQRSHNTNNVLSPSPSQVGLSDANSDD